MEELQDENGEEEEKSVKLCRTGGGGGWDGGRLLKGSPNAETQQKPENTELSAQCIFVPRGDG